MRRLVFVVPILAGLLVAASSRDAAAAGTWVSLGPRGGSISHVVVSPARPAELWATTGSLFRSTDGGRHWLEVRGGIEHLPIRALVPDTATPSTAYALTASGIHATTDGGASWTARNRGIWIPPALADLAAARSAPHTLYAVEQPVAGDKAVYRSRDGGLAWQRMGILPAAHRFITLTVDPSDADHLVVGTVPEVLISHDAGRTWRSSRPIPTSLVNLVVVDPRHPATLYAALSYGSGSGLFRSTDDGRSWAGRAASLDRHRVVGSLWIDPASTDWLFATDGLRVYGSRNGGATWTVRSGGLDGLLANEVTGDPAGRGTLHLAVSGSATRSPGILRSDDRGSSWVPAAAPPRAALATSIVADAVDGSVYTSLGDRGIWKKAPGRPWREVLPSQGNWAYFVVADPLDPQTLFASMDGGGLRVTRDGGATWQQIGQGLSGDLRQLEVDPSTPSRLYGVDGSELKRSTDGGATWLTTGFGRVEAVRIAPGAPATVYANGTRSDGADFVARSTDSGTSWTEVFSALGWQGSLLAVDPQNAARVFARSSRPDFLPVIVRSTDGGASWSDLTTGFDPIYFPLLWFDPAHPGRMLLATGLRLRASDDDGVNWTAIDAGLAAVPVTGLASDPAAPDGLLASTLGSGVVRFVPEP